MRAPGTALPPLAEVYGEFNALHLRALQVNRRSSEYREILEQMELIVADVRRVFGGEGKVR